METFARKHDACLHQFFVVLSHCRKHLFVRQDAGLLQVVSRRLRVDQAGECCGAENAFVMEQPSDGWIYRAGRGLNSKNFEFPGYCVLRTN